MEREQDLERRTAAMSASRTLVKNLQGRWLLVSADDESWKRIRQDFDFILEFEATTRFRIVMKPKTAKAKALLAGRSDLIREEDYRIEDGLFVQSYGGFDLLSRLISNQGDDELVFERVRISGWCFDDSKLNDCKVVLRRIRE